MAMAKQLSALPMRYSKINWRTVYPQIETIYQNMVGPLG